MPERTARELFLGEGPGAGSGSQNLYVNLGPAHPAMHGIIRIFAELDGEVVVKTDVEIGYLHRAFEKDCEIGPYNNAIPFTDRLNYVSPLINNFAYASAMELGAFTVFLYMIKAREFLWELVEDVTGARLTISYGRVGGVKADLPEGFAEKTLHAFKQTREVLDEVHRLLTGNRIFMDRMVGVGALSREETIGYAITGPLLRAVGVGYDVRRAQPYYVYDRLEFEIPTQKEGDNYARYLVRMAEMEQSMRIVEQALAAIPSGPINVDFEGRPIDPATYVDRGKQGKTEGLLLMPITLSPNLEGQQRSASRRVNVEDKRVVLPPKETAYGSIEGLMNHFMLIMEGYGIRPPAGEAYVPVEGANGELGFYVVSDGSDRPYRVRCRPPCLPPLPVLYMAQETFGWISLEVEEYVATLFGLSPAHVHEVVTFYTLYFRERPGRHVVAVCHNLSCHLAGAPGIIAHVKQKLGIDPGETTEDGRVTFLAVECLCACEAAPMAQVDDRYELNLTPEKIDRLLEGLR